VKPGDSVAVFGCGGVGLSTVQMATLAGANVTAIDIFDAKLEQAKKFGAVQTLNISSDEEPAKKIRKLTGGGVDIAFEVIGNPKTIQFAYDSVKWGGRVVVVGYTEKDITINAGRMMFREIEMLGSLGCGLQDYPKIIELARFGKIKVREIVTHKFRLEEISKGFEMLDKGDPSLLRAVVVF
jgi:threonine dehydrogenase-like Zn-dependent dehydrogenase